MRVFLVFICLQFGAFFAEAAGVERACGNACVAKVDAQRAQCGQDAACKARADIAEEDCVSRCSFRGGEDDCLRNCERDAQSSEICSGSACNFRKTQRIGACKKQCHLQNAAMRGEAVPFNGAMQMSPCIMQCMTAFRQQQALCRDQNCLHSIQMQSQQCPQFCQSQQQMMPPPGHAQGYNQGYMPRRGYGY